MEEKILLTVRPRGFCAGVARAVEILETALSLYGPPLYVRREIVHNTHVLEGFRRRGVIFVDEVEDIPRGAVAVFSAHGVAPAVHERAGAQELRVIDATCPLVAKVHVEAIRFFREGYTVILIGHQGHDEVLGTLGVLPGQIRLITSAAEAMAIEVPKPARVAVITQTTLSVSDTGLIMAVLRARFPELVVPACKDICYATQNRQMATRLLASRAQVVLVVGSANSSNANRLKEVANEAGAEAYLIEHAGLIHEEWIQQAGCVGLTAGASTPELLVEEVAVYFRERWPVRVVEIDVVRETVSFPLPAQLYQLALR